MSRARLRRLVRFMDRDFDGTVSVEEFCHALGFNRERLFNSTRTAISVIAKLKRKRAEVVQ